MNSCWWAHWRQQGLSSCCKSLSQFPCFLSSSASRANAHQWQWGRNSHTFSHSSCKKRILVPEQSLSRVMKTHSYPQNKSMLHFFYAINVFFCMYLETPFNSCLCSGLTTRLPHITLCLNQRIYHPKEGIKIALVTKHVSSRLQREIHRPWLKWTCSSPHRESKF